MARSFNGTNQSSTNASAGVTATPYTISLWFQDTNAGSNNGRLISMTGTQASFLFGGSVLNFSPNAGTNNVTASATSKNTWYNAVATVSAAPLSTLYVSGVSQGTPTSGTPTFSGTVFTLGANGTQSAAFCQCEIADVALWTVVLTQTEVTALAQGARPYTIRPGSLRAWWPLDGLQSPEPDLSLGKFNQTLTNGPTLAFGPPFAPLTPRWPIYVPFNKVTAAAPSSFLAARAMRANQLYTGYPTM